MNRAASLAAADQAVAITEDRLAKYVAIGRKHLANGIDRTEVIAIMYRANVTGSPTPALTDEMMRCLAIAAVQLAELSAPPEG